MIGISNFICFDLEGPLSPEDNAYQLMKRFPEGGHVFEVISRYDDLLAMEKREGYEPGDTLALIAPFLMLHNISDDDIIELARAAHLTGGAEKLVSWLQWNGWKGFCITTAYEPYAHHITNKLGIFAHNVASTPFPVGSLGQTPSRDDLELVRNAEEEILTMDPAGEDDRIKKSLDAFFWEKLPATGIGPVVAGIKPVGGGRKVDALNRFAEKYGQPLSGWAVLGDSITDFRMLEAVDGAGGLAIAFNANQYALPAATMGLASTDIANLGELLKGWQKGRRKGVEKLVREREKSGGSDDAGYFSWLGGREDLEGIIATHQRVRNLVRDDAGKLG